MKPNADSPQFSASQRGDGSVVEVSCLVPDTRGFKRAGAKRSAVNQRCLAIRSRLVKPFGYCLTAARRLCAADGRPLSSAFIEADDVLEVSRHQAESFRATDRQQALFSHYRERRGPAPRRRRENSRKFMRAPSGKRPEESLRNPPARPWSPTAPAAPGRPDHVPGYSALLPAAECRRGNPGVYAGEESDCVREKLALGI